jgi:DNA anti-recombination protein RmuC
MNINDEISKLQADLEQVNQQINQLATIRERIVGALAFAERIRQAEAAPAAESPGALAEATAT